MPCALVASVVLVVFAPACGSSYTELEVRDAREIAIDIETPHGRETILPAWGGPREVELPRTMPP